MVRALASHQGGPGSNPGVDAICGLSLLLVLSFAPRGFSPGTPVFPSPQKPAFPNSNSTMNQVDEEPLCGCATLKLLFIYLFIYLFCGFNLFKTVCERSRRLLQLLLREFECPRTILIKQQQQQQHHIFFMEVPELFSIPPHPTTRRCSRAICF